MEEQTYEYMHFTESIYYQIELTAKYLKILGEQVFQKYNLGISASDFAVLDILNCNPQICQRDIAKIILKDRANTGKILDNLEKLELIERELTVRNNRPVKMVKLTDLGKDKIKEVLRVMYPTYEKIRKKVKSRDLDKVSNMLKDLRQILNETLELTI